MNDRTKELYGDDIRNVGFMFADRRRSLNRTQLEVAEDICRSQSRVSDLEQGIADPRLSSLIMMADALGCDLSIRLVPHR